MTSGRTSEVGARVWLGFAGLGVTEVVVARGVCNNNPESGSV